MRWGGLNRLRTLRPLPSCSHLCCGDAGRTRGHVHSKLQRQTVHPSPNWPWSCLACKIGHDWVPSRWYSQSPALSASDILPQLWWHEAWVEILKATHFPSPRLDRFSLCSSFIFSWFYFSNILFVFFFYLKGIWIIYWWHFLTFLSFFDEPKSFKD